MRLSQLQGAYAMALLAPGRIFAARDPYGFRPLVLGRLEDAFTVSSETCAFDLISAETVREVGAGEVVGDRAPEGTPVVRVVREGAAPREARCIFEHVYFARPDSVVFGNSVADVAAAVRRAAGAGASRSTPDIVVPVPDSGVFAALGYALESGHPVPVRAGAQSLRRPHVHRAEAGHPQLRREGEAESGAAPGQGQARDPDRRLDRARHDVEEDRAHAQGRRRGGGAHAHLVAADVVALLLRHRHAGAHAAHRRDAHARRDPRVHRSRLARYLSEDGMLER